MRPVLYLILFSVFLFIAGQPPSPAAAANNNTDILLADIARYDYGQPLAPLIACEQHLHAASPSQRAASEAEMLGLLGAPGTTTASQRVFIDWLGVIGSDKCVPALARLAAKPDLTFNVCRALAAIPGTAAEKALIALLDSPSRSVRFAAINALGQRRAEDAVPALTRFIDGEDTGLANAALESISAVGTFYAVEALRVYPIPGPHELPRARALLAATANAVNRTPPDQMVAAQIYAGQICNETLRAVETASGKIETARALVTLSDRAASGDLLPLLADPNPRLRAAVAGSLAASPQPAAVKMALTHFPRLPTDTQLAMLTSITSSRNAAALPIVDAALASGISDLRIAAIAAAAACGGDSLIPTLVHALGSSDKNTALAAQYALQEFSSNNIDALLLTRLSDSNEATLRARLLTVLAARQEREVFAYAAKWTSSSNAQLRAAAFTAISRLIRPSDLVIVLPLASNIESATDRREWTQALFAAVASEPDAATAAKLLAGWLSDRGTPERAAVIGALTVISAPVATDTLKSMLASSDSTIRKETIRALSAARTPDAYRLLLKTASTAPAPTEQILALVGAIATLEKLTMPSAEKVTEYRKTWNLATRSEERQTIVAAVRKIRHRTASAFLKEIAPE